MEVDQNALQEKKACWSGAIS